MMNKEEKTTRMTLQQREVMLGFMKEHENFARGKISNLGPDGAKVKAKLMENMADELNSLPNGATKSGDKWMKSWQDWRSDVKSKAAKIKRSLNGTGGGPPTKITLTPLEKELMGFLGKVVAEGLSTVADPIEAEACVKASAMNNKVWEEVGENILISLDMASVSVPSPPKTVIISPQQSSILTTPSLPGKKRKRKHARSEASSSHEVPDKLLQLSEEQNQLLKRKIELKEEMVAIQRQSLAVQEKQAAAIEKTAISITSTMQILQDAIKMWQEKKYFFLWIFNAADQRTKPNRSVKILPSDFLSLLFIKYIYIYIYIHVVVCMYLLVIIKLELCFKLFLCYERAK